MTWVRIDDAFPEHAKVEAAGEAAGWMFVCALCYCARALNNGFISDARMRRLTTGRYPERTASALVRVGLWERVEGGFRVHDYLHYQIPADEVKAKRRANAERQERYRRRQQVPVSNADSNALQTASVTPSVTTPHARDTRVGSGGESSSKPSRTTTARSDARTVDQDAPPEKLAPSLRDAAHAVLARLQGVHSQRGGNLPTMRGVGLAVMAWPDRDHDAVAAELEHWALAGHGQNRSVKDWAKTYRTFLGNSPAASPTKAAKTAAKSWREPGEQMIQQALLGGGR